MGPGLTLQDNGTATVTLDQDGPLYFNERGQVALRVAAPLVISGGSPRAIHIVGFEALSHPTLAQVRNSSRRLRGKTLQQVIDNDEIELTKNKGVAGGYPELDATGHVIALRGGIAGSVATLDASSQVPASQLGSGSGGAGANVLLDTTPPSFGAVPAASLPSTIVYDGDTAGGDLTGTYPNPGVADDSHAHTASTLTLALANLSDVSDVTPKTGSGGTVVMSQQPVLEGPTIDTIYGQDGSEVVRFEDVPGATNTLLIRSSAGSDAVEVQVLSGANAPLNLTTSGSGPVQANGVAVVVTTDARLSDARAPTAHAASHLSGGSDAVKLDDLAAPDDNTDLNASTTKHGLQAKGTGSTTTFYRSDATQAALPAASTSAAGIVELATNGENAASVAVQGNDTRLVQRGTSFPTPEEGIVFYRTDLEGAFYYDSSRSKWLSLRTFEYEGNTSLSITSGAYLNFPGGPVMSGTLGYKLYHDMTLCEMIGYNADGATNATLRVRKNGTNTNSLVVTAGVSTNETTTNTDYASADVVSFLTSTTLVAGCGIRGIFRRRAS